MYGLLCASSNYGCQQFHGPSVEFSVALDRKYHQWHGNFTSVDQIWPEEILIWTEMEHMDPTLYKMCFVNYLFDSHFGCFALIICMLSFESNWHSWKQT